MSANSTDAMQKQGTRELDKALKATFPASDPVAPAVPKTSLGAPKDRKPVEPTGKP